MNIKIAPSILSADFGKLNEEVVSVEQEADLIHVDVMDGHFVPNLTFGAPVVKCIKSSKPLDVHLMIENPENFVEDFFKAGSSRLTIHIEACEDAKSLLTRISEMGMEACICLKPATPVSDIEFLLDAVDGVLVMTVEPGFGGQEFMVDVLDKVRFLRKLRPNLNIEVDGGINDKTARLAIEAGANILVSGSYIFGAVDRIEAIRKLRGE